jgi:hypothetical protein
MRKSPKFSPEMQEVRFSCLRRQGPVRVAVGGDREANAFIDEHRARFGVELLCRALPVAPSACRRHAARHCDPALLPARAKRDAQMLPEVQRVYDQNLQVYGADKVWRRLRSEGTPWRAASSSR